MFQRIVLALTLLCAATAWAPAHAQEYPTDRGAFLLRGGMGFSTHVTAIEIQGHREEARLTHFHFNPSVQYFVLPGLAIGGTVGISQTRNDDATTSQYRVGPQLSYYFGAADRNLVPYVSVETTVGVMRPADLRQTSYGASAGVVYMLTRSVGVDVGTFYRLNRTRGDEPWTITDRFIGMAVGFSAFAF